MGSRARTGKVADTFLSAALDPGGWDGALRAMANATGSAHGQLIGFGKGAAPFNWISDIDQDLIDKSSALDLVAPDLNFRVAADRVAPEVTVVHEDHYDVARQSLRATDYLDLCADFDIFEGCQTRLLANDGMMIGLALLREAKDGRTTAEERDVFAEIAGHARTAVRMRRAIDSQGFALLSGAFESMDRACWLLDATGRVGGMTPRAEALLSGNRLRLVEGWLASARPEDTRRITRGVRAVLEPPGRAADPIILTDEDGGIAILLEIFPLPVGAWTFPFAPRAVIVARLGAPTERQAQLLIRTFGLTPAEADIAIRLAAGQLRTEIARARGVSTETLKVQLRSIYEKTGCGRESQLVRLVGLLGG